MVQALEPRQLRSGSDYYTYDGSGNNLAHPEWGSVGQALVRVAAPAFADGIDAPAGADRPSARLLSNSLMVQRGDDIFSSRQLSDFAYAWGQLVDHDLDLVDTGNVPLDIAVPQGDRYFDPNGTGTQVIPMERSVTVAGTGVTTPAQFPNSITSFLDGSVIYGSDAARAAALRSFVGGRLATTEGPDGELMPYNTQGLPNQTQGGPASSYFLGGDVRANENSEEASINTLLVRNHNRLAGQLAAMHPDWTDEQLYQEARKLNVATIQEITYDEFLPALMGDGAMPAYSGYDPGVDPTVSVEFAEAGFRMGHSMLGNDVQFFDDDGGETADAIKMFQISFNPSILEDNGIASLLKYLNANNSEENDLAVVDSLRNVLFGLPGQGGLDLAAIDVQRGREVGLADYNSTRVALGLPALTSFSQITSNVGLANFLQQLYGSIDDVDLMVGGLAEDHLDGSSLGPTFQAILVDQFTRTRAGDRFWYQNVLTPDEMAMIQGETLTRLIADNTSLRNMQANSFFFDAELTGTVFDDANGNGAQDQGEQPIAGTRVFLVDDGEESVLDYTDTDADGHFAFKDVQVGDYSVTVFPPDGTRITTPDQASHHVAKGEIFAGNDFGLQTFFTNVTPSRATPIGPGMPDEAPAPPPDDVPPPAPAMQFSSAFVGPFLPGMRPAAPPEVPTSPLGSDDDLLFGSRKSLFARGAP